MNRKISKRGPTLSCIQGNPGDVSFPSQGGTTQVMPALLSCRCSTACRIVSIAVCIVRQNRAVRMQHGFCCQKVAGRACMMCGSRAWRAACRCLRIATCSTDRAASAASNAATLLFATSTSACNQHGDAGKCRIMQSMPQGEHGHATWYLFCKPYAVRKRHSAHAAGSVQSACNCLLRPSC